IRSLAHDLGAALGTGAYLDALVRTRHGPFGLDSAITLEDLELAFKESTWQQSLHPPESILAGWPVHQATREEGQAIAQGRPLHLPPPDAGRPTMMAANSPTGDLLAILYWDDEKKSWHP